MNLLQYLAFFFTTWHLCIMSTCAALNPKSKWKYNVCLCETKKSSIKRSMRSAIVSNADEGAHLAITCCAKRFIGDAKGTFNTTWTFSGKDKTATTLQAAEDCFGQVMMTPAVLRSDAGNYTCIIEAEDGTRFTRMILVYVHEKRKQNSVPILLYSTETVYSKVGMFAAINCTFFIDQSSQLPRISWRKWFIKEKQSFRQLAASLPQVKQNNSPLIDGKFSSQLLLFNLSEQHFGTYTCLAKTLNSIVSINITLVQGVSPEITRKLLWTTALYVTSVAFFALIISLFFAYRLRYKIAFKLQTVGESWQRNSSNDDFSRDVFIVHGPSAAPWVDASLLQKLERQWGYECFVPDRDILAGKMEVAAVCEELERSRRTLIVVTKCLLESCWCSFVTCQAIQNSLSNTTKVFAILLTDISDLNGVSSDIQPLLKVLKIVKKISCPLDFSPCLISPHRELNESKREIKLSLNNPAKAERLNHFGIPNILKNNPKNHFTSSSKEKKQMSLPNSFSSPNLSDFSPPSPTWAVIHRPLLSLKTTPPLFPFGASSPLLLSLPYSTSEAEKSVSKELVLPAYFARNQQHFTRISASLQHFRDAENLINSCVSHNVDKNCSANKEKVENKDEAKIESPSRNANKFKPNDAPLHFYSNGCSQNSKVTTARDVVKCKQKLHNLSHTSNATTEDKRQCQDDPFSLLSGSLIPDEKIKTQRKMKKDTKWILKNFILENPNKIFWQKVRFHLPSQKGYKNRNCRMYI